MGGYDDHPHSWPPAHGFPTPSHTRPLSCVQLRVQSCAIPPTAELKAVRVLRGLTAGICATQREEKLGLYRCLRAGAPQASRAVCAECAGPWGPQPKRWGSKQLTRGAGGRFCPGELCHTGQGGDPSLPTSDSILTKGWPNCRGHAGFWCPPWCTGSANHHPAPGPGSPGRACGG